MEFCSDSYFPQREIGNRPKKRSQKDNTPELVKTRAERALGEVTRRWVVPVQSSAGLAALGLKLQYTEKGVVVEDVGDGLVSPGSFRNAETRPGASF